MSLPLLPIPPLSSTQGSSIPYGDDITASQAEIHGNNGPATHIQIPPQLQFDSNADGRREIDNIGALIRSPSSEFATVFGQDENVRA